MSNRITNIQHDSESLPIGNNMLYDVFSLQLEPFEGEVFRDVVGFDGMYTVSNFGKIKSERRERSTGGFLKERILKIAVGKNLQCGVNLWENGNPKHFSISILVADAFIKKQRDGLKIVVIHKDKNQKNNRLENLIVDTKSVCCKIDYQLGLKDESLINASIAARKRGQERYKKFGIYDGKQLVGFVCKRCFKECSFNEFRHTNTICNNCKAISEGVLDIGKIERRKELSKAGLQECSKCKKVKSFNKFHKNKRTKNMITSSCIECS